jgi:hypothetical protein
MAEASSSLKLIREAAAACAVQLTQLFPADFGLDARAESDAAHLDGADSNCDSENIESGSRQQRQRQEGGEAALVAESWLEVLENGDLPFHAIILAYLNQPEKLRLQETCLQLCASLHKAALWRDLDLMYVTDKQGNNGNVTTRAGPEQLALNRAVIAQPKYSVVYSVCLAGAVMGTQTPLSWGKKKRKNDMGVVGKHLLQEVMQALPDVQSLNVQLAYLLGKAGRPLLPANLVRGSMTNLKCLACTASLTLLRPVLTYCQQLAHLHLSCAAAYASQVIQNCCLYTACESCIIKHLCIV